MLGRSQHGGGGGGRGGDGSNSGRFNSRSVGEDKRCETILEFFSIFFLPLLFLS